MVDTSKQTISIPSGWVTNSADIVSTPGVYVLQIAQIGDVIYYKIVWPDQVSSGTSGTAGLNVIISAEQPTDPTDGTLWIQD